MSSQKIIITFFICFLGWILPAQSQSPTSGQQEALAREELNKRGIDETELRKRLEKKGIDLDKVDPVKDTEAQKVIQETIDEIQKEKANANTSMNPSTGSPVDAPSSGKTEVKTEKESVKAPEPVKEPEPTPTSQIYGQDLFRDRKLTLFTQVDNVKPKGSYVLGVDDEINISIFGASKNEASYTIDKNGFIYPERLPRIYLKGLTLDKARELLYNRYKGFYNFGKDQFYVALKSGRSILVGIYGNVFKPGSYTLSSTNSAFNALVAAGGPTDIGTLRNIKLIRKGKTYLVDVYAFMDNPNIAEDFYLEENDIIQVPQSEKIVGISGAVNKSFLFELNKNEGLNALIQYASGLKADAVLNSIQLTRYENDKEIIIDIPYAILQKDKKDFTLKNGDRIVVKNISRAFQNKVNISGEVEFPNVYAFTEGMRISDLLKQAVLTPQSRLDLAYLQRLSADGSSTYERINIANILSNPGAQDNKILKPDDLLIIFSLGKFTNQYKFTVKGAIRDSLKEFSLDNSKNIKVSDAIIMSGGLTPEATNFGYLIRTDTSTGQNNYLLVNLAEAIAHPGSAQDVVIQALDVLSVFSKKTYINESNVKVSGAVRSPGEFRYDSSLTLKDVIIMAGGFKLEASSNRIDIFRVIIKDNIPTQTFVATVDMDKNFDILNPENGNIQLQPFDQINVRNIPRFEMQRMVTVLGEVNYPGEYAIIYDNETLSSLIKRAGGMTPQAFPDGASLLRAEDKTGYVVMDLDQALKNKASKYDYILKAGDVVTVPKQKDLVGIQGAIRAVELYPQKWLKQNNKINVAWYKGKNAKFYIDEFGGGLAENSKKSLITVEYPGGKVKRTKKFLFFNIYPKVEKGSIVSAGVYNKPIEKTGEKKEKKDVDWGTVIKDSVTQATALITLIFLIQSLK